MQSVQSAVCNLLVLDTKKVELHRTELDWSPSGRIAGLAGLDGVGFEFEEGGTPQMAASPSGGRGKSRWRAGGSRCGANVQARVGHAASTCRIWILEAMIKWSLNCARGSAALAALAFQGLQVSARPRVGDGRKVAGSPEQRWQLGAFRLRKFTSSIRARNGDATAGATENHSSWIGRGVQ